MGTSGGIFADWKGYYGYCGVFFSFFFFFLFFFFPLGEGRVVG